MVTVRYGGLEGQTCELKQSPDFLAVRTRSGHPLSRGPAAGLSADAIEGFERLFAMPEAGVEVFRRQSGRRSVSAAKKSLRDNTDVRFAGKVLVDGQSGEPVIYTENIFVKFDDAVDAASCLGHIAKAGLTVKRHVSYLHNSWFVAAPEGTGQQVFEMAIDLLNHPDTDLCHPELIRRKSNRQIFDQQWHLKSTTVNGMAVSAGVSADKAHLVTRGAGTVIAVIDDGIDVDHPEFSGVGKVVAPRDATAHNSNPRPKFPSDNHGTPCAGVACANGIDGASGVAPEARLMPIRLNSHLGSQDEADAIAWAADNGADIISCSWGPRDGEWWNPGDPQHNQVSPIPDSSRLAIEHAVNNGRNGRGCVIFWAAGNGNESVDNDGYASHPSVYAIAACNDTGKRSVYSDFGNAIFCAFPSNDFSYPPLNHPAPLTPGIWATDRRHGAGYNEGNATKGDIDGQYTNSFGGTSSATPGAAGIAALILSLNPDLHWQQVGDVMRQSCDVIDPSNGNYQNGHSPFYGHGRLNAESAVQLAVPQQSTDSISIVGQFNAAINDNQTTLVSVAVSDQRQLVSVSVEVDIRHSWIGDLQVALLSPGGDRIVLHDRSGFSSNDIKRQYDSVLIPELADLAGAPASGDWQLEVTDHANQDQGSIRSFALHLQFASAATRKAASRTAPARKKKVSRRKKKVSKKKRSSRRKSS